MDAEREPVEQVANKYAKLPPRPRPEDLRTTHDTASHADVVGEADRERDWVLRTTGIFI